MFKTLLLPAIAGALLATATTSASAFGLGHAQDRWEKQQILKEEFRRSREVGGSTDPITALFNLFSGTATERDVRPGVNHIQDVPGYGGLRLKGRWNN